MSREAWNAAVIVEGVGCCVWRFSVVVLLYPHVPLNSRRPLRCPITEKAISLPRAILEDIGLWLCALPYVVLSSYPPFPFLPPSLPIPASLLYLSGHNKKSTREGKRQRERPLSSLPSELCMYRLSWPSLSHC